MQRAYGWRNWRDALSEAPLAALLGAAIPIIESGGSKRFPDLHTFTRNITLGLAIFLTARLGETLLSPVIERSRFPSVIRTLNYILAGWIGFVLGLGIAAAITGAEEDDFAFRSYHFAYSLASSAAICIVIGFIVHRTRVRNEQLRRTIERLKEHEFAEKELELAREVQQRLLPPGDLERGGYRITARTHAARLVGGDFYDLVRLNDGHVAIVVADVSGKGMAASLLMATCKAMVPFVAASGSAAEAVAALNERLCEQLRPREFVAMTFVRFDPATGRGEVVNAGMPDPFVIGADGAVRELAFAGDRYPLGLRRTCDYRATPVELRAGERLLLFSDGFPEAVVGDAQVGYDGMGRMVRSFRGVDALIAELRAIDGVSIDDDLTVLMLERVAA